MLYFQLITGGVSSEQSVLYFEEESDAAERFSEFVVDGLSGKTPMGSWARLSSMPDDRKILEWHQTEAETPVGSEDLLHTPNEA